MKTKYIKLNFGTNDFIDDNSKRLEMIKINTKKFCWQIERLFILLFNNWI